MTPAQMQAMMVKLAAMTPAEQTAAMMKAGMSPAEQADMRKKLAAMKPSTAMQIAQQQKGKGK